MKWRKILVILTLALAWVACQSQGQDPDLTALKVYGLRHVSGQSQWVLDQSPLFTGEDVQEYIWETHTIIFKDQFLESKGVTQEVRDRMDQGQKFRVRGSSLLDLYYPDRFAVYLDDQELYQGHMVPQDFISFYPSGPVMEDHESLRGVVILCLKAEEDTRHNPALKDFLKEAGLLK